MSKYLKIYHTHMELYPYEYGDYRKIEEFYSVFDTIYHKYNPIAYYIENNTLYLPKGTSVTLLQKNVSDVTVVNTRQSDPKQYIEINPILSPNSIIQKEATEFLCSEGRFSKGIRYSQLGLNLDTGDGKTIASIIAIAKKYKTRTMVIVHRDYLKEQWAKEFLKATDIKRERILCIDGSDDIRKIMEAESIDYDIFLVNHQSIQSYGSREGWSSVKEFFRKIKIGVKVYDEAHKFFSNICMIDFFSNTEKTFYLTATFKRNRFENAMFKRAFSECYRFGEETLDYECKRKHTKYIYLQFDSGCSFQKAATLYGIYSVSPHKYIKYALHQDEDNNLLRVIYHVMKKIEGLEGKILISTPSIESTQFIGDFVEKNFNKRVNVLNSKNKNSIDPDADVYIATVSLLGTAYDIKKLRFLINCEPFTSDTNLKQLRGRLREYSPTEDTFMFDLVDVSIRDISSMGKKRLEGMKRIAKEIVIKKI